MNIKTLRKKVSDTLRSREGRMASGRKMAAELLWAQVFDFAVRDSGWFVRQTLNPGRWAVGFPALYLIYRALSGARPGSILEMGLGESSKLTHQYVSYYGASLTIIEQDESWRDVFCASVFDVSANVKCLPLRSERRRGGAHYSYEGFAEAVAGAKYDMVIVDGPWGSKRDSRGEVLDVIRGGLLADSFVIIVDDAHRRGEKDTVKAVRRLLNSMGRESCTAVYEGCKATRVICSPDLRFLCSL